MKTTLSRSPIAETETECLVVVALDRSEADRRAKDKDKGKDKDKNAVSVETSDLAVREAASDLIAGGEISGKMFETALLHRPAKLIPNRLLLVGGGKAENLNSSTLRKLAGTAARFLKPKGIESFAFAVPENGIDAAQAVKAVVEG